MTQEHALRLTTDFAERSAEQIDVLVVEDDEDGYLLIENRLSGLEGSRHELHRVRDSQAALAVAGAEDFDVCLVDCRLGADSGIALVRELVALGRGMPVIVVADRSNRALDAAAAEAGAAAFLVKSSVTPALLERTIRYAVQRHADLQALREKGASLQRRNDKLEDRVIEPTTELRSTISELAGLSNINQALLDATVDGIHMVDTEGATLVANAAVERLVRDVFELRSLNGLGAYHGGISHLMNDPEAYLASTEAIAVNPGHVAVDEFELVLAQRSFQRYTAPVRDLLGSLIGRIYVIRDVTKERDAERLRSDLVTTISHELRTPLASMIGFVQLLQTGRLGSDKSVRCLEVMFDAGMRLSILLDDLLDLQRIEEGSFALKLEPFDLCGAVRQEVELYAGQSPAHELHVELPNGDQLVVGERARVAQVIGNLLSNAIKYSPDGGSVTVRVVELDGVVRLSVQDIGLGIPPEQQGRIFTKFFRVDSDGTREIGGTGLGLALCREIVEAQGGQIGFESVQGSGSAFWFELPSPVELPVGPDGN